MKDLKPCPFCGGEARLTKTNHETWVSCENYHYETHVVSIRAKTESEAIEAWNTRAECRCELKPVGNVLDIRECSECGEGIVCETLNVLRFCPNCGREIKEVRNA